MDESPKRTPVIASVLAAFAACAPVGSQAAPAPGATVQQAANVPSPAALLAIELKAAQPDALRMAFIRESGPRWVQWLNQHKGKGGGGTTRQQ
jgi:hypothetical protein